MAQFVFVGNVVGMEQFERAIELANKSGGKVRFNPGGGGGHGVQTSHMHPVKKDAQSPETLNLVRFEWTEDGIDSATEIVRALAKK